MKKYASLTIAGLLSVVGFSANQISTEDLNVISTSVPILIVSPDARAGAMGDVGAASLPGPNDIFWNPAKLAFMGKKKTSLSLSYTPWLSSLVPDINLAYVSFQKSLGDRQGIGVSMRYFSLGDINFRDDQGNSTGTFSPYEFSIDGSYALKFSEQWSGGIALRYIYSDIAQGQVVAGAQTKPGQSVAADIAFFYKSRQINMSNGQKGTALFGVNISNIGAKISYSESGRSDFIPTNLKVGGGYIWQFDKYNKVGFYLDVNKLLVPTPQVITDDGDTLGDPTDVPPLEGMIQALSPGAKPYGFNELMREFIINVGAEWMYNDLFMVRAGYQYENESKGNRKYFTIGAGIKYNIFSLDLAYLFPANQTVRSPLQNTLRFTLAFDLGGMTSAE